MNRIDSFSSVVFTERTADFEWMRDDAVVYQADAGPVRRAA